MTGVLVAWDGTSGSILMDLCGAPLVAVRRNQCDDTADVRLGDRLRFAVTAVDDLLVATDVERIAPAPSSSTWQQCR